MMTPPTMSTSIQIKWNISGFDIVGRVFVDWNIYSCSHSVTISISFDTFITYSLYSYWVTQPWSDVNKVNNTVTEWLVILLQMILQLVRRFHITPVCQAAESSLLAKLRKKTGYTIANCKKALEMNNNDSDKVYRIIMTWIWKIIAFP